MQRRPGTRTNRRSHQKTQEAQRARRKAYRECLDRRKDKTKPA